MPGGLGLDREFFESILVPQVMLYGFMGFKPTADGCEIAPRLPADWPSLTIVSIHLHGHVLDVTARGKEIKVIDRVPVGSDGPALQIETLPRWTVSSQRG